MSLLNPWWRDGTVRPELAREVRRDAFAQCWDLMDTRQVVAIGGLRRVGKTTLMYQMIQELLSGGVDPMDILYFSLDERREGLREVLDAYASSVGRDIESGRAFVFLDEIQKHAGWTDELKLLYDALPDFKFVVSGSAALGLERRGRESLAGRMFFTRVEPLSFSEWLTLRGIGFRPGEARLFEGRLRPHLLRYMMTPFPEIVSWDEDRARRYVKESIVDRVVYMDVPQEFGDADHALLEELIGIFFSQPGSYLNVDALARELGRGKATINNHMMYLRFSYLVRLLGNYRGSRRSSSRKMRRVYPYTPALTAGLDVEVPKLVENLVVSHLNATNYWRERRVEVDVFHDGLPIEVKYRTRVGAGDLAGLRTCMRALKRSRGLVVSKGTTASKETEEGEIDIVPAWEFLLDTAATEGP
jgi:predicted AAA+ superfamily ATPase